MNGRAVVITGLPFPPKMDAKVHSKSLTLIRIIDQDVNSPQGIELGSPCSFYSHNALGITDIWRTLVQAHHLLLFRLILKFNTLSSTPVMRISGNL